MNYFFSIRQSTFFDRQSTIDYRIKFSKNKVLKVNDTRYFILVRSSWVARYSTISLWIKPKYKIESSFLVMTHAFFLSFFLTLIQCLTNYVFLSSFFNYTVYLKRTQCLNEVEQSAKEGWNKCMSLLLTSNAYIAVIGPLLAIRSYKASQKIFLLRKMNKEYSIFKNKRTKRKI